MYIGDSNVVYRLQSLENVLVPRRFNIHYGATTKYNSCAIEWGRNWDISECGGSLLLNALRAINKSGKNPFIEIHQILLPRTPVRQHGYGRDYDHLEHKYVTTGSGPHDTWGGDRKDCMHLLHNTKINIPNVTITQMRFSPTNGECQQLAVRVQPHSAASHGGVVLTDESLLLKGKSGGNRSTHTHTNTQAFLQSSSLRRVSFILAVGVICCRW
eukprot:GHVR01148863.1.p1 GENE.GHVR01148863.1~~GHVR01148863.1.p1  ORF type:complete len:214 (-),score=43.64 GHVR01148863.1:459-1100(-)